MEVSLALFDENHTHIEFFTNSGDLALFLAQTVRALAKKASSRPDKLIVDMPKVSWFFYFLLLLITFYRE